MNDFSAITHEHATYKVQLPKWQYTADVFTGDYADKAKIEEYLNRRKQGESDGQYDDRKKNAKVNLLLSTLFGMITGQLFGAESKQAIKWGDLGDPSDSTTRAYQIKNNVDGEGTNLTVWLFELMINLLVYETVYILVDGPPQEDGPVSWIIWSPDMVPDWMETNRMLSEVKVKHTTTERVSLMDEPEEWEQRTFYTLDGFTRHTKRKGGKDEDWKIDDGGEYEFHSDTTSGGGLRLPVVRVSLPLNMYVGYLLARDVICLFNLSSEQRNVLRMANTPRAILKTGMSGTATEVKENAKGGGNWLTMGVDDSFEYAAPPIDSATVVAEIIKDGREDLFQSAYQRYGNAAMTTATEIHSQERGGREAFLALAASAIDEALGTCLFLTEQIEFPAPQQARWGKASAKRQGTFRLAEPEAKADKHKKRFYGEDVVPTTLAGAVQVARQQHEAAGIPIEDEETFGAEVEHDWRLRKIERVQKMNPGMGLAQAAAAAEGDLTQLTRTDFTANGVEQ